jgi:hypothetical protein
MRYKSNKYCTAINNPQLKRNTIINVPLLINVNDVFRYFKFKNAGRVRNFLKTVSIGIISQIHHHFNYRIKLQQQTNFALIPVPVIPPTGCYVHGSLLHWHHHHWRNSHFQAILAIFPIVPTNFPIHLPKYPINMCEFIYVFVVYFTILSGYIVSIDRMIVNWKAAT